MSTPISTIRKRKQSKHLQERRRCQSLQSFTQNVSNQHSNSLSSISTKLPSSLIPNFLCTLPPDVSMSIIEHITDSDISTLPKVCRSWRNLFTSPSSPLYNHFRHAVRAQYKLFKPETFFNTSSSIPSWGTLYLSLRRERCHLCPRANIHPFVYAGSGSLSAMLSTPDDPNPPLTLFPLCTRCFWGLLRGRPREPFIPVVDARAVHSVFKRPRIDTVDDKDIRVGFLYSDMPRAKDLSTRQLGVRYVLANKFAPTAWLAPRDVPTAFPEEEEDDDPRLLLL